MYLNACDICKKVIFGDYLTIRYNSHDVKKWDTKDVCLRCMRRSPFFKRYLPPPEDDKGRKSKKN